ncbi:MAG TPA: hypothetical protein PLJ21_08375 [Pseudobdellovibrionaceae bacterium]|nr:hypothetical protein [Pseudobdellovibrionaceae bacterium]
MVKLYLKIIFLAFSFFNTALAATYLEHAQESIQSIDEFRINRNFGLRSELGGALGAFSLQLEVNYEPSESAFAGVGKGPGYESFGVFWKHYFEPNELTLFNVLGYSRWYNSSADYNTSESGILQRALNEDEKSSKLFVLDFMVLGFGILYTPQSSNYLGFGYFLEVNLLYEYKKAKVIPTGGVGLSYNF